MSTKRVLVFSLLASFLFRQVWADDVYNFYFQKADTAKIVQNGKVLETKKGVNESPDKPSSEKESANKTDVTPIAAPITKTSVVKKRGSEGRDWTLRLGLGSLSIGGSGTYYLTGRSVQSSYNGYVVGANYHFSSYFDLEGDIMFLDKERAGNYGEPDQIKDFAIWSVGFGVTPIHLNIFGREFLRLGLVVGAMGGSGFKMPESSSEFSGEKEIGLYYGPRLDISFSEKLSLQMVLRIDQKKPSGFHSGMTLNYDF